MKKRILFLLASALLFFGVRWYAARHFGTPVLMYHDLHEDAAVCALSDWTLQPEKLREDLTWLRGHGYTTVLPRELAAGRLDDGSPLPRRIVLLTFDDGYESNFTLAQPILEEFGARAAVAVIVSRVGQPGFLTWDECRAMVQSGVWEFGSHTYDRHIRDDALGVSRLDGETREQYTARIAPDIEKSVALLQSELGIDVRYFAYPLGRVDAWCDDILSPCFDVTVTTEPGRAAPGQLEKLPRCNITQSVCAADYLG